MPDGDLCVLLLSDSSKKKIRRTTIQRSDKQNLRLQKGPFRSTKHTEKNKPNKVTQLNFLIKKKLIF